MVSKKVEQENLCVKTKFLIDQLRTNLFLIEDFRYCPAWDKRLSSLRELIDDIYWRL